MFKGILILIIFIVCNLKIIAQDITPPDTPVLDSVSVQQSTGYVYLGWEFSDSLDVKGYIIYRQNGVIWQTIDTVKSPYINHFLDTTAAANFHFEVYRIAAYDSSLNRSPMTDIADAQSTIYAFPYLQEENCVSKIKLVWNSYQGWSAGVQGYRIYRSVNYGSEILLTAVTANITTYDDLNLLDTATYCYYIRAVSFDGKTSSSNKTCAYTNLPGEPKFAYINFISDTSDNGVNISFSTDTSADIKNYKLLRSNDINGIYDTITKLDNITGTPFLYTDNYLDLTRRYYYKLVAYNPCNAIIKESNISGNIVLNTTSGNDSSVTLSWNPYINWQNDVEKYNVYKINDNGKSELMKIVSPDDTIYTQDIVNMIRKNVFVSGHFCFYIEAIENGKNSYGIAGRSLSNVSCIEKFPFVFVPNAFTPNNDGINDIFMPSLTFISKDDYFFSVYDRWGEVLWSTSDCTEGWDGKTKGKFAKEGVYIYYLKYKSVQNEFYVKCGYFTLIQ